MVDYADELDNAYPFPLEKVVSSQKVEGFSPKTFPSTFWVSFWLSMIFLVLLLVSVGIIYLFLTKEISIITYVGTNPIKS